MGCREFGERLASERIRRGLGTQKEFGILLGDCSTWLGAKRGPIPLETVNRWEKGRRYPVKWIAYCICKLLDRSPEDLSLHEVLTPTGMTMIEAAVDARRAAGELPSADAGELEGPGESADVELVRQRILAPRTRFSAHLWKPAEPTDPVDHLKFAQLDWERLGATIRSVCAVDKRVVQDQWMLTQQYASNLTTMSPRTMLDLIGSHLARLRQLYSLVADERLHHELGLMICQSTVLMGILSTGLTDYGLATEAYRYCIELAQEIQEPDLSATALILQAQLHSGLILPQLPPSRSRILKLIDASESYTRAGTPPQVRVFVHSTRSGLRVLLQDEAGAWRDIEAARCAEAQVPADAETYFALAATSRAYRMVHEALVMQVIGQPMTAVPLYHAAIERTATPNAVAWLKWCLASTYVRAREPELAVPAISEAIRLVRGTDSPLLIEGAMRVAEGLVGQFSSNPIVRDFEEQIRSSN